MEIRLLNGNEIGRAVQTANEVFECCNRGCVKSEEEIRQYYDYVRPEMLGQAQREGRLFLWGIFEGDQLWAVSAMYNTGHISLLHVLPAFQRRGLGSWMLNEMLSFAEYELHLPRVTVNVTPKVYVPFFLHRCFQLMPGTDSRNLYTAVEYRFAGFQYRQPDQAVEMPRQTREKIGLNGMDTAPVQEEVYRMPGEKFKKTKRPEVTYPKKKVSGKAIFWVVGITLLLCVGVGIAVTIQYFAH